MLFRSLRQTDSEIIDIDNQIKDEIKKGIIPDPNSVDPITGQPLPPEGQPTDMGAGDLGQNPTSDMGQVPKEPDLETQAAEFDKQLSKDSKKAEI